MQVSGKDSTALSTHFGIGGGKSIFQLCRIVEDGKGKKEVSSKGMLKHNSTKRNDWLMGLVANIYPTKDGKVCKLEVKTTKGDTCKTFLCPVTGSVLLLLSDI